MNIIAHVGLYSKLYSKDMPYFFYRQELLLYHMKQHLSAFRPLWTEKHKIHFEHKSFKPIISIN